MYDYQKDYTRQAMKRERKAYKKLLSIYNALLFASDEGVYEITIRSQAGAIVVPVSFADGCETAQLVIENLSARIDRLEGNLNNTIEEAGKEATSTREKEQAAGEAREAQNKQNRLDYEAQGRAADAARLNELVAQATSANLAAIAAAPAAKRPAGRARRAAATVAPEQVSQVAQQAALVPMNAATTLPTGELKGGVQA